MWMRAVVALAVFFTRRFVWLAQSITSPYSGSGALQRKGARRILVRRTSPTAIGGAYLTTLSLSRLETDADAANQDIRLAVARVDQGGSRRQVRALLPLPYHQSWSERFPNALKLRPAQQWQHNGRAATFNDFQLPAFLSYEVDAWGACAIRSIRQRNRTGDRSRFAISCALPWKPT